MIVVDPEEMEEIEPSQDRLVEYAKYKELGKKLDRLTKVLRQVYEVNERGGPGSRRMVRDLLRSVGD